MQFKHDEKFHFNAMFDPKTGFYMRSGVLDKDGKDTGKDPFMASFPELLDIGVMQTCVCAGKCSVGCYQKAADRTGANMSVEDYESILKQCKHKAFQISLGGAGDVDTHENFREIMELTRKYDMVPNFTTSGIAMTEESAKICAEYAGAVAVSEHFTRYTRRALDLLIGAGVKTNIHYVLGTNTIDAAIDWLEHGWFHKGINAVVFLLHKPVGYGSSENVLNVANLSVERFFKLIDKGNFPFKIGFDSCSCPGIVNFTSKINLDSLDFCEGGRFSAYIDANMNMMPCSFANQNPKWFVSLREHSVQEAWDSDIFDAFRGSLKNSCLKCENREYCHGGCPLVNEVTLCGRKERKFAAPKI